MNIENESTEQEIVEDEKMKILSIRAKASTRDALVNFAKTQGINVDEGITSLLSTYELVYSKKLLPNREKEIETFESYIVRLIDLYKTSLEINMNSELLAKEKFIEQLESKDKAINALHTQETERNQENSYLKDSLKDLKEKNKEIEKRLECLSQDFKKESNHLTDIINDKINQLKEKDETDKINRSFIKELTNKLELFESLEKELLACRAANKTLSTSEESLLLQNKELELNLKNKIEKILILENQALEIKEDIKTIKKELKEEQKENKAHISELEINRKNEVEKMKKEFEIKVEEMTFLKVEKIKNEYESQILELNKKIFQLNK